LNERLILGLECRFPGGFISFERMRQKRAERWLAGRRIAARISGVKGDFNEPLKKRVGGSLRNLPILSRAEMLRANARVLTRQTQWKPPPDDGTLVRKVVGSPR